MDVFFDPSDGRLLFTISGEEKHGLKGARITVTDADLGPLTGWRVQDGALLRADLQPARDVAIRAVNTAVGALRLDLITDIPGQMAIYQAKEAEARAYLAAPEGLNTLADFPLLAAEVGITAPNARDLAQVWLNLAALFRAAAAQTEQLRLSTHAAIAGAKDEAALDAALAAFTHTLAAAAAPQPERKP